MSKILRLEKYTEQHRQEVLLVTAIVNGIPDQIAIFRGFSSSLVQATAADPDVPMLPEDAEIVRVDRLHAPYDPEQPRYVQAALTWQQMAALLEAGGF